MVHIVKIRPEHFEPVKSGNKTVEIRKDDRGYQVGDKLILAEWDSMSENYTGRACHVTITHILSGEPWLKTGYVALSIKTDVQMTQEQVVEAAKAWRSGLIDRARTQHSAESERDNTYMKNLQATMNLTSVVDELYELEQEYAELQVSK